MLNFQLNNIIPYNFCQGKELDRELWHSCWGRMGRPTTSNLILSCA